MNLKSKELNNVLISMKKMIVESNGGKMTATFEKSGIIDGWHWAITVQKPGFKPEKGDWKLNVD
jgi:hypothetical protein